MERGLRINSGSFKIEIKKDLLTHHSTGTK